jgi:hypothetical protein
MFKEALIRLLFLLLKGGDTMVTVYVTLIIKGYKTFIQVPNNLKPAVEAELLAMDLDTDGKPIAV